MLILYWLKWYTFDPELPSALNMLAVAVQSNICFCFLPLLLFYFFPPPLPERSCCSAGWEAARLSPRGGRRFPAGEMLLGDTPSVAHPPFAHTRSPGIFQTSLQTIPSWWGSLHPISWCTAFLNPVFELIPSPFLFDPAHCHHCSVLFTCFISLLSLGSVSCQESTSYLWRQSRAKIWEGVECPVPAGPGSLHHCKQCLGCCSWK